MPNTPTPHAGARVNMPTSAPSRKVVSASTAAAISGFILWILAEYVFHDAVPEPVAALVLVLVPGLSAFLAGYVTKRSTSEL